jgi:hypothetical protein
MRRFFIAVVVVGSISAVAACSKLYSDHPTNLNNGPDASPWPNDDASTLPPDAKDPTNPDSGCGGGGDAGTGGDDGGYYPDAGPCCNQPPDASPGFPDAY